MADNSVGVAWGIRAAVAAVLAQSGRLPDTVGIHGHPGRSFPKLLGVLPQYWHDTHPFVEREPPSHPVRDIDPSGASNRVIRRIVARYPGHMVHLDVNKVGRIPDGGGWRVHGRGSEAAKVVDRAKAKGARAGYASCILALLLPMPPACLAHRARAVRGRAWHTFTWHEVCAPPPGRLVDVHQVRHLESGEHPPTLDRGKRRC